jgi:hypothetical protein
LMIPCILGVRLILQGSTPAAGRDGSIRCRSAHCDTVSARPEAAAPDAQDRDLVRHRGTPPTWKASAS